MAREMCFRCFWPLDHCWCSQITAMETRTKFVFLMHPKEFKQEKAGTGRLTHLSLADSEIHMGIGFDGHPAVQALIADPSYYPVLLYPGDRAQNISLGAGPLSAYLENRRLLVFLLDATWACAKKMLKLSPSLQALPRLMFTPTAPSRFVIKQQPHEFCLSTLEATHQFLEALQAAGLDRYPLPDQLLGLFDRMQAFQIQCATDPSRDGYRRGTYRDPSQRVPTRNKGRNQHSLFFKD